MKVSRIEIKDFQQFKDFELDLTYPEGHAKAGQPLDKVCFIGQSGTGKTTILKMISDLFLGRASGDYEHNETDFIYKLNYCVFKRENIGFIMKFAHDLDVHGFDDAYHHKDNFTWDENRLKVFFTEQGIFKNRVIFLETGLENHSKLITGVNQYSLPPVHTQGDKNKITQRQVEIISAYNEVTCISSNTFFSYEELQFYIFQKLYAHNELVKEVSNKLYNNALNGNIEKILLELKEWKEQNPNPRLELSKKLEKILAKFNLKIDTESTQDYIKLKTLQDTEISIQAASTGTKQILLSAIPLALMETANKIILFDEPERSLFPDIQRTLINYYTELAPEAQFFFATHSPIIASQFEPWEIVELKFDENGNVYREDYLKKGMPRHIDNYQFYPKYMRWDSILTEIYDLDTEGQPEREEELEKLAETNQAIKYYKEKGNAEKVQELVNEYKKIAEKLRWKIDETHR